MSINSEMALDLFVFQNEIDLIAIQETGTNWSPSDSSFKQHKIMKKDGDIAHGTNGVALIIKKTLQPEIITDLMDEEQDAVWCQIKIGGKRYIVGSVYCKPSLKVSESVSKLDTLLSRINDA